MGLTYSQIDTLLPQHLNLIRSEDGVKIYSWLLAANSIVVMLGLYPVTWLAKRLGPLQAVVRGQIIMAVGFAAMAFTSSTLGLLACMVVLTIGEVFAFSNWSVVIDRYAKEGLKGSYFGAAGLSMIGHSVGPLLGGLLYQSGGVYFAFILIALCTVLGTLFYGRAENLRTPQHT